MSKKCITLFLSVIVLFFNTSILAADEEELEEAPKSKPSYISLGNKAMVLNLSTDGKRHTFLQIKADVLVKNDEAKKVVEDNIPAIRHKLIVLLSEQKAVDMKTPAKREEVRKQATDEIRTMLGEMANNSDIDEILFSNFLVQ